jgi:hypothetical protein
MTASVTDKSKQAILYSQVVVTVRAACYQEQVTRAFKRQADVRQHIRSQARTTEHMRMQTENNMTTMAVQMRAQLSSLICIYSSNNLARLHELSGSCMSAMLLRLDTSARAVASCEGCRQLRGLSPADLKGAWLAACPHHPTDKIT